MKLYAKCDRCAAFGVASVTHDRSLGVGLQGHYSSCRDEPPMDWKVVSVETEPRLVCKDCYVEVEKVLRGLGL